MQRYSSIEDREKSVIIDEENRYVECLERGENESWDEFLERVSKRVEILNKEAYEQNFREAFPGLPFVPLN